MIEIKHLRAVLLLPFMVTVVVPALLLRQADGSCWHCGRPWSWAVRLGGIALAAAGVAMLAWTASLLGRIGRGTLAPWDPTRRLVVAGPYQHVRNPMISGVFAFLLGEALFFGQQALLVWFVAFVAINATYIPLLEEPGLSARFGGEYADYRRHVPRWLPRMTPWQPSR